VSSQFTVTPTDVIVNATESTAIECSHPNASTLSWRHNDVDIVNGDQGFLISTNNETSTLSIAVADPAVHGGQYECVAVTENGTELGSVAFSVTVQCECAALMLWGLVFLPSQSS